MTALAWGLVAAGAVAGSYLLERQRINWTWAMIAGLAAASIVVFIGLVD